MTNGQKITPRDDQVVGAMDKLLGFVDQTIQGANKTIGAYVLDEHDMEQLELAFTLAVTIEETLESIRHHHGAAAHNPF